MNMVDDATSKTLALMDYGETTRAAFALLKWWILEAGVPLAIYVDLKSLYVSPRSLRTRVLEDNEQVEAEWLTHFSKACKQLGITLIKAHSPQAKGRVERSHAVYQDRLVKEMALRNIDTIEGANELLSSDFVNHLNEKFAKPAESEEDAHVPLYDIDLDQILCWEYDRQVKQDWTIQFNNQYYQIEPSSNVCVQAKQTIQVRKHLDNTLSLWYRDEKLSFHLIDKSIAKPAKKTGYDSAGRAARAKQNKHKTPWGQYQVDWLKSPATRYQKESMDSA